MAYEYEYIGRYLPDHIEFVTTQQLEDMYPDCTPKEREYRIAKLHKAVFIEQIGDKLASGEKHDGRAPDYDDWKLNGDIIVYYPCHDRAGVDRRTCRKRHRRLGGSYRMGLGVHACLLYTSPIASPTGNGPCV